MLKRETLFEAMGGVEDGYILSAADLLGYAKEEDPMRMNRMKKTSRVLVLAAVIAALLAATALASYFAISHRVPSEDETFRIHWGNSHSGYLDFKGVTLALSFPDVEESREIEFRPGWLPEKMASLQTGEWQRYMTAEQLALPGRASSVPEYENMWPPMRIETYLMSQFNDGGAMLLQDFTAGEITEEHWTELDADVMYFRSTWTRPANPEHGMEEETLFMDYVLLCNAQKGWIVRICGQIGMEQLLEIARNLEIRETGKSFRCEDFLNHYALFNGGVG